MDLDKMTKQQVDFNNILVNGIYCVMDNCELSIKIKQMQNNVNNNAFDTFTSEFGMYSIESSDVFFDLISKSPFNGGSGKKQLDDIERNISDWVKFRNIQSPINKLFQFDSISNATIPCDDFLHVNFEVKKNNYIFNFNVLMSFGFVEYIFYFDFWVEITSYNSKPNPNMMCPITIGNVKVSSSIIGGLKCGDILLFNNSSLNCDGDGVLCFNGLKIDVELIPDDINYRFLIKDV